MEENEVKKYYDRIADEYDVSRFGNSYGTYLHSQENNFLQRFLHQTNSLTLDMGCGTGRFLRYADYGIDISEEMLKIASGKHPDKNLIACDAENTPFSENTFDQIICMHMFMHLTKEKSITILNEAGRILKPGGYFIVDFPSEKRRSLLKRHKPGWHGSNALRISEIRQLAGPNWEIKLFSGLLFFPIHRIPSSIRPFLVPLDSFICGSPLKEFSSYLIVVLQKK